MTHHEEHTELLGEILSGTDAKERFEESELANCEECRAEYRAHVRLLSELEELGAHERAGLAAASETDAPAGRAEEAFRAHVLRETGAEASSAKPSKAPSSPSLLHKLLIAAAAVIFAVVGARILDNDSAEEVLGEEGELLHPVGQVETFLPFRWDVTLPDRAWFSVHAEGEGLDLVSPQLSVQEWNPEEEIDWPREIRWTLEVRRGTGIGEVIESYVEWAEL